MNWLRRRLGSVAAQITTMLAVASVISVAIGSVVFMVVVATHGRSGLAHVLMGSVALFVIRRPAEK